MDNFEKVAGNTRSGVDMSSTISKVNKTFSFETL